MKKTYIKANVQQTEYTPIEYIEGIQVQQFFDLKHAVPREYSIEMKVKTGNELPQEAFLYGARESEVTGGFALGCFYINSEYKWGIIRGATPTVDPLITSTDPIEPNTEYLIKHVQVANGEELKINNILEASFSGVSSAMGMKNIYLFIADSVGGATSFPMKFYYCKIYKGETLYMDLIPVLDKDNIPCLYDKLNKKFYYNQASGGEFLTGPEVSSNKILVYPVEYIEANGTQFIDTGVIYDYNTTQFDIDFQFRDATISTSQYLSVSWSGSNNDAYILGTSSSTKFICGTAQNGSWTQVANYDTNRHTWRYNDSQHKIYIDNTAIANKTTTTPNGLVTMRIFRGPGNNNPANARVYGYKITNLQTEELIRDFVPVRTEENEYCLYDKVSKKLFKNQGTGDFLGGEDVSAVPIDIYSYGDYYYTLDCLYLTSERYIDTDLKAGPLTRVYMDFKTTANIKNQNRFFSTWYKDNEDGTVMESYINGSGNFAYAYNNKNGNWKQAGSGVAVAANTRYQIDLDGKNKTYKVTGGASISETLSYTALPTSYSYQNILLNSDGYLQGNSTSNQNNDLIVYSCKIYEDGTLVRDLIPVEFENYVFQENAYGMLDRVHNVFYPIQGHRSHMDANIISNMTRTSNLIEFTGLRPVYKMYGTNGEFNNYKINFDDQTYYQLSYVDTDRCIVNTGLKLTTLSKLEMKFSFNKLVEQNRIFDFPDNSGFYGSAYIVSGLSCLNGWVNRTNTPGSWRGPTPSTTTTATTAIFDLKNGTFNTTGGMVYSGTQLYRNTPTTANSGDLYLFSSADGWNQTDMRFYYLKIYEDDVLTHEIVPAKNTKTSEIILYDKTTSQIYRNIGPGRFKNSGKRVSSTTLPKGALEGYFYDGNGSHTISTSFNGFTLTGKKASAGETFNTNIRWYTTINTRVYKRLSFMAQMTKVHGYIWGGLYDGTNFYRLWSSGELNYHSMRDGDIYWKKFDIDLSGFNGLYQVWFCGGRDDNSGNDDSSTSYRDITLIGAKESKKAYINVNAPNLLADAEINYGMLETTPTVLTDTVYTYHPRTVTELPYYHVTYNSTVGSESKTLLSWGKNSLISRKIHLNHYYILVAEAKASGGDKRIVPSIAAYSNPARSSYGYWDIKPISTSGDGWTELTTEWQTYGYIFSNTTWNGFLIDVEITIHGRQETANASELDIRNIRLYDLTEIFGSSAKNITVAWWIENMVPRETKYFRDINLKGLSITNNEITCTIPKTEYLQSNGVSSYFDTGLRMPYGFRATGKIEFTEIVASKWNQILASQTNVDPYQTNAFRIDNSGYWATGDNGCTVAPAANTQYTFDVSTRMNGAYLKIDDTTVISNYTTTWRSNYPLYLFNVNSAGTASSDQGCKMKVYWLKIYDASNKLVADYTPIKGKGFYDAVSNQVLYCTAGSFTDGPELEDTITYTIKTGTPRLTFERDKIIEFSSDDDLIPHQWWNSNIHSQYRDSEAVSALGWWMVRSTGWSSSSYPPKLALDGDDSTYFYSEAIASGATGQWLLQCPKPVCPMQIDVTYNRGGPSSNPPKIMGYNIDTQAWEKISDLSAKSSKGTQTITLSNNKFYAAFRIDHTRYSSSYTKLYLYTFKIKKGKVMLTPGINNILGDQTFIYNS